MITCHVHLIESNPKSSDEAIEVPWKYLEDASSAGGPQQGIMRNLDLKMVPYSAPDVP